MKAKKVSCKKCGGKVSAKKMKCGGKVKSK